MGPSRPAYWLGVLQISSGWIENPLCDGDYSGHRSRLHVDRGFFSGNGQNDDANMLGYLHPYHIGTNGKRGDLGQHLG